MHGGRCSHLRYRGRLTQRLLPTVTLTDVTAQVARHRQVAQARTIPYPRLRAVAKEHTNTTSHEYLVIARR